MAMRTFPRLVLPRCPRTGCAVQVPGDLFRIPSLRMLRRRRWGDGVAAASLPPHTPPPGESLLLKSFGARCFFLRED